MSQTFVPSASAFHSEVAQCPDTLSVGVVLQRAVEPIGFTASAAGAFVPARRGAQSVFFFQNWPTDWLELYQRENFVNHDFTVAEARTVIAPFFWSEVLARRKLTFLPACTTRKLRSAWPSVNVSASGRTRVSPGAGLRRVVSARRWRHCSRHCAA